MTCGDLPLVNAPFTRLNAYASLRVQSIVQSVSFVTEAPSSSTRALSKSVAILCLILGLATLMQPLVSSAQNLDPDDPFAGIEEMVVVGTGAASLFQDQEISAIAFDAEYLDAIGANDISDVATFTPNLEIRTPFAASNPTLFIRGVGLRDFNANSSSSVAVYNDEIYMNSPAGQLAQLFDVQNIDVLRGPQATMYGRNASAGAIRVVARKPTGVSQTTGSITYGRFNELNFDVAVENVIIPDRLSIRSSAKWSQRDGTTKNRCADKDYALLRADLPTVRQVNRGDIQGALIREVSLQCFSNENTNQIGAAPPQNGWTLGQPAPVKEWVNDTKNWAARTILRYRHPFLDMDWQLNLHGGQNRGDARQFQMVAASQRQGDPEPFIRVGSRDQNQYLDADNRQFFPNGFGSFKSIRSPFDGNPFEGDYNAVEKEKIDLFGANIVGELTFGDYTFKTITGYEWNKRATKLNLDGNPAVGLEPVLGNKSYQLTEEVRLDWDDGSGLSWQLAGMFMYEALEVSNTFSIVPLDNETEQDYTFLTRYGAVWLDASWEPAETFQLKGGVRLNYEEKELSLQTRQYSIAFGSGLRLPVVYPSSSPLAGQVVPALMANSVAQEFGWAGEIVATYRPTEDTNFYLRYARGWKGPHINGGITNPGPSGSDRGDLATPVEPEIVDSVELGLKAEFWSNRIRWNWAVFMYDYQDIQVFQLKNAGGSVPVQQLINAADADVFGVEMEIDAKPFEGWAPPIFEGIWIRLTFAYLDSKYTDFVNAQDVVTDDGSGNISRTTVTEDFSGKSLVNSPEFSFIGFAAWPVGGDWGALIPRVDWSYKDEVFFSPGNAEMVSQDSLWLLNFRLTYKSPADNFELSGWVKNLTDQAYTVDVFNLARLRSSILHAIGDPRTYGLTFKVTF